MVSQRDTPANRSTLAFNREKIMAVLRVEKFVDGGYEASFNVPTSVLRLATKILPRAALQALAHRGLDLHEVLTAQTSGAYFSKTVMLRERGFSKRIELSLR
jgi:hypothetical protein